MLNAVGVTVRFGKRTLFEDVNIKFNKGCCYGIIGANGAGKSTFLKVLSGELEPSKGEVTKERTERLSVLKQDHFAYEEYTVLDTVIMGNQELYSIMKEKNEIYAKPDFSEEDGMKAAKLEERFAELDGWNAESDAGILLNGLGIEPEFQNKLMQQTPGLGIQNNIAEEIYALKKENNSKITKAINTTNKTSPIATEAGFLQKHGIDTVVFGAGNIQYAHTTNEYIEEKQISNYADALIKTINSFDKRDF